MWRDFNYCRRSVHKSDDTPQLPAPEAERRSSAISGKKDDHNWCTRQDSNLEPSDPKSDTLSIELRVREGLEIKFISDQQELQVQKPLLAPHLSDSRSRLP